MNDAAMRINCRLDIECSPARVNVHIFILHVRRWRCGPQTYSHAAYFAIDNNCAFCDRQREGERVRTKYEYFSLSFIDQLDGLFRAKRGLANVDML